MQHLSLIQPIATKFKGNNKRQFVLSLIKEEIDNERIGTKYKPVYPKALAVKVAHLKIPDLEYMHSICKDYKTRKGSYSKCFFGALKNK